MEHPVLRIPFCCLHPCRTADLMTCLLSGETLVRVRVRVRDRVRVSVRVRVRVRNMVSLTLTLTHPRPHPHLRLGDGAKLDYLSAWWSVVAPHVGVRGGAARFAAQLKPRS